MKKYRDYTKEQLLDVIILKNSMINRLNGKVHYYQEMTKYYKEKYKKEKKKNGQKSTTMAV